MTSRNYGDVCHRTPWDLSQTFGSGYRGWAWWHLKSRFNRLPVIADCLLTDRASGAAQALSKARPMHFFF
jgi:hypothetical protein